MLEGLRKGGATGTHLEIHASKQRMQHRDAVTVTHQDINADEETMEHCDVVTAKITPTKPWTGPRPGKALEKNSEQPWTCPPPGKTLEQIPKPI